MRCFRGDLNEKERKRWTAGYRPMYISGTAGRRQFSMAWSMLFISLLAAACAIPFISYWQAPSSESAIAVNGYSLLPQGLYPGRLPVGFHMGNSIPQAYPCDHFITPGRNCNRAADDLCKRVCAIPAGL